jgi:DNA replication protein DnaC
MYSEVKGNHPAIESKQKEIKEFLRKPKNLLLAGGTGTGKTVALAGIAILWMLRNNQPARFANVENIYSNWRHASTSGGLGSYTQALEEASLLILDDIGQGEWSDAFNRWLYSVVNRRWEWGRPTAASTNMTSKDLKDMIGDALFSRLASGYILKFEGADRRVNSK